MGAMPGNSSWQARYPSCQVYGPSFPHMPSHAAPGLQQLGAASSCPVRFGRTHKGHSVMPTAPASALVTRGTAAPSSSHSASLLSSGRRQSLYSARQPCSFGWTPSGTLVMLTPSCTQSLSSFTSHKCRRSIVPSCSGECLCSFKMASVQPAKAMRQTPNFS